VQHEGRAVADAVRIKGIRKLEAPSYAVAAEFIGSTPIFVLAENAALLVRGEGPGQEQPIHDGAILCATRCGDRLLTGGDDGKVISIDRAGASRCLFSDSKGRWVDHVAADRAGRFAWSIGNEVFETAEGDGVECLLRAPSSVGGLVFSPVTKALAVAHYDGVTLCERRLSHLSSKGLHQDATFSREGSVLVCALREPTLHAWRLADRKELPVPGYPSRVKSMDWTASGRFLATAGSDRLVLLSFQTDDNPLAQMPLLLAPYKTLVAVVACHPIRDFAAVGYEDGLVLLVRIPDGAEIMIKAPDGSPITAMQWDDAGAQLAVASENEQCRIYSME
jgi:WD40 repeat protein